MGDVSRARIRDRETVYLEAEVPEGVDPWWVAHSGKVFMLAGQHGKPFAEADYPGHGHASWLEYVPDDETPDLVAYIGPTS